MGYAINTILVITMASTGFAISQLLKHDIQYCASSFIKKGVIFLFICIVLIMLLILNRLIDFRDTAKIARKREKGDLSGIKEMRNEVRFTGRLTWYLLYMVIISFIIGHLLIMFGVYEMV
jgi:hypothetical protein